MTDAVPVSTGVMTLEEFIRRSEQEGPFEILDGEIVQKMATVSGHNKSGKRVFLALLPYEQQGLGQVFQEATYVLTDIPDWVKGSRIPDVMFVSAEKIARFEAETANSDEKPYILVPDLVVEIVSPNDTFTVINKKVKLYLTDGVKLVWVIDPETKDVYVYMPTLDHPLIVSGDGVLTGGDVLPDFQLKLSDLFA